VKYAFDTNIFVDSFRSEESEAELLAFLKRALPFTFMSAVVMQELAVGARTTEAARNLRRSLFEPFERRGRVFAPTAATFVESGSIVASLASMEGLQVSETPSLLNDALIAASCRERGITLITRDSDFDRLLPFLKRWRHVPPWPAVPSGPRSAFTRHQR
jgi:predicted nucleic acid-binding protein